ncbi:MAG TPA: hypothetical protein VG796_05765 [Verrucomicrobiales bacterium]|jgi:hypothetical protein|nr:hypothetical protein [Verrucomicrobiales bacterium]
MKNHLKNFLLGGLGGITAALAAIGLKHLRDSSANEQPPDDGKDDSAGDPRNGHSHRPFYIYGRSSRHSSPRPALASVQRHAPGRYYHRGNR